MAIIQTFHMLTELWFVDDSFHERQEYLMVVKKTIVENGKARKVLQHEQEKYR